MIKDTEFCKDTNAIKKIESIPIKEEQTAVVEERDTQSQKIEEKINEVPIIHVPLLNYHEKREALKNRKITPDYLVQCPYEDHTYALSIASLENYLSESGQLALNHQEDDTDDAEEPFFMRNLLYLMKTFFLY